MTEPATPGADGAGESAPRPAGAASLAGARSEGWLRYWRDSLADADLPSPVLTQPDQLFEIELDDLESGQLPQEQAHSLFLRVGRPPPRDEDEDEDPPIPLRIALLRLRRIVQHGKAIQLDRAHHAPLWIAVRLLRSGRLLPPDGPGAWLARRYLEPVTALGPAIGTVDAMDEFLTRHSAPDGQGWSDLWAFAESLFSTVAGRSPQLYEPEGYRRFGPVVDLRPYQAGAGDALIKLCDQLLESERPPALFERLTTSPAVLEPADDPETLDASRRHLGQMTGRFALGPAQRRALHAALRLEPGELVAVNGPPGTGKTTLVQSLLASAWVGRALRGEEPPLVVVCSTNNRAITNVLDSFAATEDADDAASPDAAFGGRWLPDLPSYGLYLPAASRRLAEEGRYAIARAQGSDWSGFPQRVEQPRYAARARAIYLERARDAFGERFESPEQVVERLHAEMTSTVERLRSLLGESDADADRRTIDQLEIERRTLDERLARLDADGDDLERLRQAVGQALTDRSLWSDVLSFVPAVRARRADALARVFEQHPVYLRHRDDVPTFDGRLDPSTARTALRALEDELEALRDQLTTERGQVEARLATERAARDALRALGSAIWTDPDALEAALEALRTDRQALEALLDRTLRRRLFFLAGRYWEGRWLLAIDRVLARPELRTRQSRRAVVDRFRRWSMLTPILVATLYRMPRIFDFYDGASRPLVGTLDLLIVDEAGQVPPEVGAPIFALARRAVVVGDVHQLEPIWKVGLGVDHANLREHGIDPDTLDEVSEGLGLKASEGSLMRVARRVTRFGDDEARADGLERSDGLWLRGHRRSVPPIVRFCNNLVYRGLLEPLRDEIQRDRHPLPALGYGHVGSTSERDGSSRRNPGQADALAEWLGRRREQLEDWYREPIERIACVVTPFSGQIRPLLQALERHGLPFATSDDGRGVTVGTVHTFQGGERPVVLFSPAVAGDDSTWFLDRAPNLLNVAVSRARDAFLVLGDMGCFDSDPDSSRPTSILARQLLESIDHVVADVVAAPALRELQGVERLVDHEAHRLFLRRAFKDARKRIAVCSPYLTLPALQADGIPELVTAARRRKIRVVIGHSPDISNWPTESAEALLRQAGADIVRLKKHHAKTLAVDDHLYVEGSYNWLSAARDPEHPRHFAERSIAVEGRDAEPWIKSLWRLLRQNR